MRTCTRADWAEASWLSDGLRSKPHVALECGHLSPPGSGPLAEAGYGYCLYHGVTRISPGTEITQLKTRQSGLPGEGPDNTAEPSGELSVGDVVAVTADGEVRLAVARDGWDPVPGPLTEVRTSQHGTRPLPLPGRASAPETEKENHGE